MGDALKFATGELKSDRDCVLAAVRSYGSALQFAAEDLKRDRGVVLAAVVREGSRALRYAPEEIRQDVSFVRTVDALEQGRVKMEARTLLPALPSCGPIQEPADHHAELGAPAT